MVQRYKACIHIFFNTIGQIIPHHLQMDPVQDKLLAKFFKEAVLS